MKNSWEPGVEFDFNPFSLPPDYQQAIGLATACAAQNEEIVAWAIAGCLGIDLEYGIAVTAHMSAPLRDDVLKSVAEIRIDDLKALDRLDALLIAVKSAQDRRNALAHQSWCIHPDGRVFRVSQRARGSVQAQAEQVSVSSIRDDAAAIYTAGIELLDFLTTMSLLPPIPPVGRGRAHKTKAARKKRREE